MALVALSILPIATHAAAKISARGCLPEGATNLRRVTVRFNGLEPAKDVARFYEKLRSLEALPCRELTLDKQILSEALMAADQRATPGPWVTEMEALICKLNPRGCAKGRPAAKTFVVPNVRLTSYFPFWKRITIDANDAPEKDLEGVMARHHVSLPDQADSMPKIDRAEWLENTRKNNLQFTRRLTKATSSERGNPTKTPQLVVPIREYSTTLDLPSSVAELPQKAFGISDSDFSFEPQAPLQPTIHSNGTATLEGAKSRFTEVLRQISMPKSLPAAESASASIIVADRGIDPECLFLHPDRTVPASVLAALGAGIPPCNPAKHGTHVWGIIGGLVPDIMRGVALIERGAPTVETWDFDQHDPSDDTDLTRFVHQAALSARVANFSFNFGRDITQAQNTRIVDMVGSTPLILYVVAADNKPTAYKRGPQLTLPTNLNELSNVIVVTALNEAGTGIWDQAARDASETDDVVQVAAPGIGIPSPCGDDDVGLLDGTSQATAFVSGAAALLVRDGLDDSLQIKRRLAYSADVLPDLITGVAGGRLNVGRALGARHDKVCEFSGGDGIACDPWTPGVVTLGYQTPTGFVQARSVVLRRSSGQPINVSPAHLLRVARMPAGPAASADGFVVFYLEADESRPDRLRRKRVMKLDAFSDGAHSGPLVLRQERPDGTTIIDLESLGDFVKRGA